jgi:hypothetical protein
LEKREEVLQSTSHLVELDLQRGGARLPTIGRVAITIALSAGVAGVREHSARYDLTLDYRKPLDPPLSEADAGWAGEWIRSRTGIVK